VTTDKLYLVGFMGAGKTSAAAALGQRLGWRAADIDQCIEAREHRTVATIFQQDGEAYFRRVEREALAALVPERQLIVATGGGTFVDAENRGLMLADGQVAWLDVPLTGILERIPQDGSRPLAADRTQLEQLYLRREIAYRDAHVRIDASGPVPEVVERLLAWLEY
jgi:shikimate kinase